MSSPKSVTSKSLASRSFSEEVKERIKEDFVVLVGLDEKLLSDMIGELPRYYMSDLSAEDDELFKRLSSDHEAPERDIRLGFRGLGFVVNLFLNRKGGIHDDEPVALVNDFRTLEVIEGTDLGPLETLISSVKSVAEESIAGQMYEKSQIGGNFPSFNGIDYSASLRLIPQTKFVMADDPDLYVAKAKSFVPVVSLYLSASNSVPENFSFQMVKADVERVIKVLQASLKDISLLEIINEKNIEDE